MKSMKSTAVIALGVAIALLGAIEAFGAAGANPNPRVVYGWSMMVILGLFLISWGLMNYVSTPEGNNRGSRPASTKSGVDTTPTSSSRAKRRGPSNGWYRSKR